MRSQLTKRILSEDQVSAEGTRGSRAHEHALPQAGIYIPNYKSVNQVIYNSGGSGRVNFMNTLKGISARTVAEQQALYDTMEINGSISNVDIAYRSEEERFLNENPTGRGYTEFATNKYSDLSDEAISNASNINVKNRMKLVFDSRKKDIANNAFQKEKAMYTSYALNEIETQTNATMNEIINTPDQIESLSVKFNSQLEGMRNILSAGEFEKYIKSRNQDFMISYGLGLIKQDSYRARELIKSDVFTSIIPNDKYAKLVQQAEQAVAHNEKKSIELAKMAQEVKKQVDISTKSNMEVQIETGELSEGDIEASGLSNSDKKDLLKKLRASVEKRQEESLKTSAISDCIQQKIPTFNVEIMDEYTGKRIEIDNKDKEKYLQEFFIGENQRRIAEGKPELTLTEKIGFLNENSLVFNSPYTKLSAHISDIIRYSNNDQEVFDACTAVHSFKDSKTIQSVDKDVQDFANYTIEKFKTSQNLTAIRNEREYFLGSVNEEYEKAWKSSDYSRNPDVAFKKFCDNRGFGNFERFFATSQAIVQSDYVDIRNTILPIMKRVILRTGSILKAEVVAGRELENLVKRTDINGKETFMINPPTPDNTGLTNQQIRNILYGCAVQFTKNKKISKEHKIENINKWYKGTNAVNPYAEFVIGGEREKRRLMFRQASTDKPIYNVYYLEDEKNPESKEYLLDKFGNRQVIDFDKIKTVIREGD